MRLAIVFNYTPDPKNYEDCETIEDCMRDDECSLNDGQMDPGDLLSVYEWRAEIIDE